MYLQLFNKSPEQYRELLNFLMSEQNLASRGIVLEDLKTGSKARIPAEAIARIASVKLHTERDGGGNGNLDITISIPVEYPGPDGKRLRISRKLIDDILDLLEVFGN